jgi:hypothetical protein
MTVKLNIEPSIEERLAERARAVGVPLEQFIQGVLEREARAETESRARELSGAEKVQAFREWADSFPADLPALALEDISRESIYRRDE